MIDASDLTTTEVRAQYVTPLICEILEKSSLMDVAAMLGIDVTSTSTSSSLPAPSTMGVTSPAPSSGDNANVVSTLFQEIATERSSCEDDGIVGHDENDASKTPRCYAEILEEASSLCAYMTPQENTIVATIASSCLLSFLIPQSHFQGFLRSYYVDSAERRRSSTTTKSMPSSSSSLEERLVNATLSNHNDRSGGVFPYSASRMRSLVVDDDGFTSPSFHRFLDQGLRSYLSSGLAFNWPSSKDDIIMGSSSNNNNIMEDGGEHGIAFDKVMFQAGTDLIQLLAMAICPNPPSDGSGGTTRITPSSLSMEADKGAGGEQVALDGVRQLAHSTLPFSFQLSYSDRLKLVRLCTEIVIPESEDGASISGYSMESRSNNGGSHDNDNGGAAVNENGAMFSASLHQLRSSLFHFASFNAHSEKNSIDAYRALANIAINEGKSSSIQAEFQRLVQATIDARSEDLAVELGDCLADMLTRYNGSRYYADGMFVRFALGLLGKCIRERTQMRMADKEKSGRENQDLTKETSAKRQKVEGAQANFFKSHHFIALLKATRPLFYFLLEAKEEGDQSRIEIVENAAKSQLIRDVTLLLCYPSNHSVVQSAAQLLALALAYHGRHVTEKSNVKHLFRYTRQALNNAGSVDIVQALKPLLITASRQSRTFAVSLFSYAVKICSEKKRMAWKIAAVISSACPYVVVDRLDELEGNSQGADKCCGDIVKDEIMARLSTSNTLKTVQRCVSLAEGVTNKWALFQYVRFSFVTSNFGFACTILNEKRLAQECSQQKHFLWLTILSNLAQAEENLVTNGAVGISTSLESLNSCQSTLLSLASSVNHTSSPELGKFGFQLELLKVRIEFLNLIMITRSLCSEIIVTGGNASARSRLFRRNIPKSFGMLKSQYINIYRLYGLHHCQQTRSVLRTLVAMCQFMSEMATILLCSDSKPNANKKPHNVIEQQQGIKDFLPKGDERHPMASMIKSLRVSVLEKLGKSKEGDFLRAPELLNLLDTMIRCRLPFPSGFFQVKSIPCSCVNISASPGILLKKQSDDQMSVDTNETRSEIVDVALGIPFKLMLSGVVSEEFIRYANVHFSQVIAWKTICYEGQLYEDDDVEDTHSASSNDEDIPFRMSLPNGEPHSTALQPGGEFILPMICDPIVREGFYRIKVKLGCRDVRCGEYSIPTRKHSELLLRVEEYSE